MKKLPKKKKKKTLRPNPLFDFRKSKLIGLISFI